MRRGIVICPFSLVPLVEDHSEGCIYIYIQQLQQVPVSFSVNPICSHTQKTTTTTKKQSGTHSSKLLTQYIFVVCFFFEIVIYHHKYMTLFPSPFFVVMGHPVSSQYPQSTKSGESLPSQLPLLSQLSYLLRLQFGLLHICKLDCHSYIHTLSPNISAESSVIFPGGHLRHLNLLAYFGFILWPGLSHYPFPIQTT